MVTRPDIFTDPVVDYEDELVAVIRHDARNLPLEDETVDLIVTSPPYFALRSYRDGCEACGGSGTRPASYARKVCSVCDKESSSKKCPQCGGKMLWPKDRDAAVGACSECDGTGSGHFDGQIGSEDTPALFLDALDECMVEWGRVLKPSGSIWLNLGDKYAGGGNGPTGVTSITESAGERTPQPNAAQRAAAMGPARAKSLMGLPWRFAIRQIDAGWIFRAEVVWDKPNGLPESVTDRVRRSHEYWFHMVKEPRYFSGVDEIREAYKLSEEASMAAYLSPSQRALQGVHNNAMMRSQQDGEPIPERLTNPLGRLPGSVWSIPSEPLLIPDDTRALLDLPDHFAAFPQEFPRRIILGWSPTGICIECGEGRRPVVSSEYERTQQNYTSRTERNDGNTRSDVDSLHGTGAIKHVTIDSYACACPTPDAPTRPSIICDPFGGTGTVAGVAKTLGRYGISNDLSASYNRLAKWRIWQSDHFTKTEQRTWADRQQVLL